MDLFYINFNLMPAPVPENKALDTQTCLMYASRTGVHQSDPIRAAFFPFEEPQKLLKHWLISENMSVLDPSVFFAHIKFQLKLCLIKSLTTTGARFQPLVSKVLILFCLI